MSASPDLLNPTTVPANEIETPQKISNFKILVFPSQKVPKFLIIPIVVYHERSQKKFQPFRPAVARFMPAAVFGWISVTAKITKNC